MALSPTKALVLPVVLLAACERPAPEAADSRRDVLEVLEETRREAEAERERMAADRERFEAELETLGKRLEEERMKREEAEITVREREAAEAMREAQRRDEELARQEAEQERQRRELAEREAEAARMEAQLGERELELAGREALGQMEEPEEFQEPVADFDLFYDGLEDEGQWFDSSDYGYVFQPTVVIHDHSWRPYTRGRWICTDRGWTWVSSESFGWATYHYGRWVLLSGRGWCWVPGSEWAPAWVAWRHGGGHVGWAPLPPETLCGVGRAWGVNVEVDFGISDDWFCFVAERHIAEPVVRHCLPVGRNAALRRNAHGCTNIHYRGHRVIAGGPSYADLRRHVGRPWPVCRIENEPLQGLGTNAARRTHHEGDRCRVFAPDLSAEWNAGLRPEKVSGRIDEAQVVRAPGGITSDWSQRHRDARERQREAVRAWAERSQAEREARLAANREKARAAADQRRQAKADSTAGTRRLPVGVTPTDRREEALAEIRRRMDSPAGRAEDGAATRAPVVSQQEEQAGRGADRPTLQERLRREQEERRSRAEQDKRAQSEAAADRRLAVERAAKAEQERRARLAEEQARRKAAADQARKAQQEAARRETEQRRQQQAEASRRAAEERARKLQAAREDAARRQAERSRQAEESRRQQAERQRQMQEKLQSARERVRERLQNR